MTENERNKIWNEAIDAAIEVYNDCVNDLSLLFREEVRNIKKQVILPYPFCGGEASPDGKANYPDNHEARWSEDEVTITEAYYCNCMKCGIDNKGLIGHRTR